MARNWDAGDLIMGRYQLVSKLGQGGMGSVWRAEHVELKNQVAIKLLDPAISQNQEMIGRFLREARAAASLQNRHVIQIFDHGVEDGEAFMVMELLEGESMGQRLERGPMPVEETIKFMVQVMRAMGKAHDAGIVHRDLKPDNIFITKDDEGEFAKVLDFGVAKVGGDLGGTNGVKTQTGMMLGTPYYMSPEQAKAKRVDARTDVWALAVITFECLTGKRPFRGESFADLVLTLCNAPIPIPSEIASVPMGFDEWFVHATQRDVEKRFRSTRDMANELIQLATAPMTGRAGASASTYGSARLGPMRTPARGTTLEAQGKMNLTTGQSASMSRSSRPPGKASPSNGVWIFATAAMLVLTAGVGIYAWKTANLSDARASASAEGAPAPEEADVVSTPAAGSEEIREETKGPPPSETPAEDTLPPAPESPKGEERKEATPQAGKKSQAEEKATDRSKKGTPDPIPSEPKPADKPDSGNVPVVDKQALPPEEWEF